MESELGRQLVRLEPGSHLCLTHQTAAEWMAAAIPFALNGLARGDRFVFVGPEDAGADVAAVLTEVGVDVERERARGALLAVTDRSIARLVSGEFDPTAMVEFLRGAEAQALADGFPGLRVAGNMTWALGLDVPPNQLIEFEILLDRFLRDSRSVVICQYDRSRFDPAIIYEVLRTHPLAVLGDLVCPNPYYEPPELLLPKEPRESREIKAKRVDWWIAALKAAREAEQERERMAGALSEYADRLKVMSRRVVEVQEDERRHLARELHDEIGQALTMIGLNLQVLGNSSGPKAQSRLEDSLGLVRDTIEKVRSLALDLRPSMLDDLGLATTLRWLVERLAQRAGLAGHFSGPTSEPALPADLVTACYRVGQEALTNVVRHSRASNVWVELRPGDTEIQLIVRDDGVGFSPEEVLRRDVEVGSLGLLGIQERIELLGGRVDIESEPGRGTVIRAWIPVNPSPSPEALSEL